MKVHCVACGMPLEKKEDIASEIDEGILCKFCVNVNGKVKSSKEIFEGGVRFFMNFIPGVDKNLAERMTRKNMNKLPYWRGKEEECLKGEEATEEEFKENLDKLHNEIERGNVNF